MKKLISLMLALIMVFSLATVASATEPTEGVDKLTFTKKYEVSGGTTTPSETITFDVKEVEGNPETGKKIVINPVTITGVSNDVVITLPTYTKVGVYTYTVTEVAPNPESQGVKYSETPFNVKVLVAYNDEHTGFVTEIVFASETEDGKIQSFTNTYELGSLAINKQVTGNLGDKSKEFNVTVTFTATDTVRSDITYSSDIDQTDAAANGTIAKGWSGEKAVTINLKHGETVTFSNIPAGVTYEVVEDDYTQDGKNSVNGYDDAMYSLNNAEASTAVVKDNIAASDTDKVVITNNKAESVQTGIVTDSAPYIILIAVCAVAAVAFVLKRRNAVEF